jgi:hypothetical protein
MMQIYHVKYCIIEIGVLGIKLDEYIVLFRDCGIKSIGPESLKSNSTSEEMLQLGWWLMISRSASGGGRRVEGGPRDGGAAGVGARWRAAGAGWTSRWSGRRLGWG